MDKETMVADNGWVIEYDIDMIRMFAITKLQIYAGLVTPEYLQEVNQWAISRIVWLKEIGWCKAQLA